MINWLCERFDWWVVLLSAGSLRRYNARQHSRFSADLASCKCSICGKQAVHWVRWGNSKQQEGNLCQQHIEEVWDRSKHLVQWGQTHWTQEAARAT